MKFINPISQTTAFTSFAAKHPLGIVAVAALQIVNVLGLLIEIVAKQHWLVFDLLALGMSLVSAVLIALTVIDFQ